MSAQTTLGFIGGGNMASSIIGGLLQADWSPKQIQVADPSGDQRARLEQKFGIETVADNQALVPKADVIVLAVKPQVMESVLAPLGEQLQAQRPLLISIAAGIPASAIHDWSGAELPLVRVMPNTPALISKGVSGLFATEQTNQQQRELAEAIMRAVGDVIWVEREVLIDAVTGVSGSGPAYFFKLMELMIEQGVEAGLDPDDARRLVVETGIGAATLLRASDHSAAELRRQVTSPNGTTQAGIEAMERNGIDDAVREGVRAAIARSDSLSKELVR